MQKKEKEIEYIQCPMCGDEHKPSELYVGKSEMYKHSGKIIYCKSCIEKIYQTYLEKVKDKQKAVFLMCRKLDLPFKKSAFDGAMKDTRFNVYQAYIQKINSLGGANKYGETFDDSDMLSGNVDAMVQTNKNQDDYNSVEQEYLKNKWGREIPFNDLLWLEQKYSEWYDNYDIQGKAMELLVEQMCFEELNLYKERQTGQDVSKRLKSIQDLMKSSKLSPKQETASDMAEFQSISEFIKQVEQKKPIIKKNPDFEDIDHFNKMWKSMAGAISRTDGKPDANTEVFNDFFKNETMDLTGLSEKGDE